MKLLTFNVRIDLPNDKENDWNHRLKAVALVINSGNYSVIGLQEPNMTMLKTLMALCPEYGYTGHPRDENAEMTPVLFNLDKVRLLTSETIWLSDTLNEISKFPDSHFNRIATIATFEERTSMKIFRFVNTHLDYANETVQRMQMEVLMKFLNEHASLKKLPCIIVGDFNATPDKKVIKMMKEVKIGKSGLTSVYENEIAHATYHQFSGKTEGEPIDYGFFTNHFKKSHFKIVTDQFFQTYPSDHFPVEFSIDFLK